MRVVGGRLRGTRLASPGIATRPPLGRVREAVVSSLGDLSGRTVLDLYAGTGSLGMECLSRGAARCWFSEISGAARAALTASLAPTAAAARAEVLREPAAGAIERLAAEGKGFYS